MGKPRQDQTRRGEGDDCLYRVANEVNGGRCFDWGLGASVSPAGFWEMKS